MEDVKKIINLENIKSKFLNSLYFNILKNYKILNGRISRNEYWYFVLVNIIISIVLSIIWNPLGTIFFIAALISITTVSVRRMHDLGKEFWFVLIPIYGIFLLTKEGTTIDQPNIFGGPPENKIKINTLYILILAIFFLFIGKISLNQYIVKKTQEKKEALYTSNDTAAVNEEAEKLNQVSLKEVEQAQTLQEIITAYQNSPRGSQAQLTAGLKWVDFCQTSREIKDANDNFSESSQASAKALTKWKELSKQEIEQAQTVQAAKEIYENAPDDNDLKTTIYNKWNELSLQKIDQIQTVKEAKELYDNSPVGSEVRTKILIKWQKLSTTEIEQVQNFEDMKTLFNNLPDNTDLKNNGVIKWISFCQTVKEIKEVYSNAIGKSEPQRLALAKWKELSKQEIEQATTLQEVVDLYNNLPDNDVLKSATIFKWISLSTTVRDIKEVYSYTLINSDERKTAFEKWNTLSLQEIEKAQTLEEVKEVYNNTPENSQAKTVAAEKLKELQ